MEQKAGKRGFYWLGPAALAAVGVLYLVMVVLAGGSLPGLLLTAAAFALLVLLPGLALCEWLLPGLGAAAKPVVAVTLGVAVLVLSGVAFGFLGVLYLGAVPPLGLAVWWVAGRVRAKRPLSRPEINGPRAAFFVLLAAVVFLCLFTAVLATARPSAVGGNQYNQDALWAAGTAGGVWYGFPVQDLRAAGQILYYNYFSELITGLLALYTGQNAWDLYFYYLPPVWIALLLLGVFGLSRLLGARGYRALVPAFGVSLGIFLDSSASVQFYTNPNNLNQNYVFILAALLVAQRMQSGRFKEWRPVPALALCLLAAIWSKGSMGLLVLCGLGAAFVVWTVLRRRFAAPMLAALALGAAAYGVLSVTAFARAAFNLAFAPSAQKLLDFLSTLLVGSLPVVALYLVALVLALRRFCRLSFIQLALHAVVAGGLVAGGFMDHPGASQGYFILLSTFFMWLCVAPALGVILTKKAGGAALAVCCAAGLAGTLYTAAPLLRKGAQAGLRCAGLRPPFEVAYDTLTPDDEAAASWLRANMQKDEMFATNRNERSLESRDGVFHGYTALSGRRCYIEGWYFALSYSTDSPTQRHRLETVSDGLFACETYAEAEAIARENGIDYLLLHLPTKGAPFEGGEPVFTSGSVLIYDTAHA